MQIDEQFLEKRSTLSAAKQALLERRLKQLQTQSDAVEDPVVEVTNVISIPRRSQEMQDQAPLSFAQQRIWFLQNLEPESGFYNEPIALSIRGQLSIQALTQAVREIMRRHEVMRATFPMVNGQPVQVVDPTLHETWTIPIQDISHIPVQGQAAAVHRITTEEMRRPFNLANEIPWRTVLVRLNEAEHISLTVMHHIITDGWSMEVFIREIGLLYAAFSTGQTLPLPEPALQYADYAHWQQKWIEEKILGEQLPYWKESLSGSLPMLELPTDRLRPTIQTYNGDRLPVVISSDLTQRLQMLSQREGATLFMTLLATFNVLLYRYSGQDDIIVGSPIAGRTYRELEDLIGCFVNTLALRTDLANNPSFQELLKRVREVTLSAYDHQDLPLEKLVQELQPERDQSRNPLFQVLFVLQNMPTALQQLGTLTIAPYDVEISTAKFDLSLSLQVVAQELKGFIEYNTDLFERQTIERMYAHFLRILEAVVADPTQHIADIALLSEAEWHQQVIEWNATETDNPLDRCLQQLFEEQVQRTPTALAVQDEQRTLTYQELNAEANQLAHRLMELGIGPEKIVAVLAERNVTLLIAILAIWKAGGVYLPLDMDYPPTRLGSIMQQSGAKLVLATKHSASQDSEALLSRAQSVGITVEPLETGTLTTYSTEDIPVRNEPCNLAYVIYTSGSTGVPKGVMIEQRGMINHLYTKIHALDLGPDDRVAQTASACFDVSIWQYLAVLLVGGSVHIYPDAVTHDPVTLLQQVDEHRITILQLVPSVLRVMLERDEEKVVSRPALESLRWLSSTGEALPLQLCRQWFERYPHIPVLNAYGPTECSDDVTHYVIAERPAETLRSIPIGYTEENIQTYVLDAHMKPVPIGVVGELYVAGVCVGRGYLHDEERTAAAFVHNPFGKESNERLYKTGDAVRHLPDGCLEFLGRIDQQVKIRGFRIELGEIETVLARHPAVQHCVVVVREDTPGNRYLAAYIIAASGAEVKANELRVHVKELLPEVMIPAAFVSLEDFPRLPNGKLDRRSLPAPEAVDEVSMQDYQAPRTPLEQQLAEIWAHILGLPRVGIDENFFEIGGHSLLVAQVLTRIRDVLEIELPLRTMFQAPTVERLAKAIERVQSRAEELRRRPTVRAVSRDSYRARHSTIANKSNQP